MIGKVLTISMFSTRMNPLIIRFGLHARRVRDESLGIQGRHSLVGFVLTKEPINVAVCAVKCLYFAFQIFWKIFLLCIWVIEPELFSQTMVSHVPP